MSNRVIVAYYSRKGHTRALGLEVCRILKSASIDVDCIEMEPEKELGILQAGAASFTHSREPIKECRVDLDRVNLLLLGTPVWGGNPAPYMGALLDRVADLKGLPVVLFTTCAYGDGKAERELRGMVRATGGRPMEYHVWRIRRDRPRGAADIALEVAESVRSLLPSEASH